MQMCLRPGSEFISGVLVFPRVSPHQRMVCIIIVFYFCFGFVFPLVSYFMVPGFIKNLKNG